MNTITQPGRWPRLTVNTMLLLLLASGLLSRPAYSGTCDDNFNSAVSWLNKGPLYWVTAVLASNRPAALPGMKSEVTYSNIPLMKGGSGWLVTAGYGSSISDSYNAWLRKQYYDQRVWYKPQAPGPFGPSYPFSPDASDSISLTIFPNGTVTVYPKNGQMTHTFTATCSDGVMYGAPAATGLLSPTPMYTITFESGENPNPPIVK